MMQDHVILTSIINFLSLILIAGLSWFLKQLWSDVSKIRNELTILQTEHNMGKCGFKEFIIHHSGNSGDRDD